MKLIMDYVTNHWGTQHWIVKDPPTKDWIHYFKSIQTLIIEKRYIQIHMRQ